MVEVREAVFDDYEKINLLTNRNGMGGLKYEEWEHRWKFNPALADIKDWPMGWVLENNEEIVGYFGNIPVLYEFKNKRLLAGVSTSWCVDADYRNYSLLISKCYFTQQKADILFNTTANAESGKVLSFFKAKKVPADSYNVPFFWIANYQKFASSVIKKKKLPIADIFSYPLSCAIFAADKLRRKNRFLKRTNREIHCQESFDENFDIFWEKLRHTHYDKLLCVRDRQSLAWHFKYSIVNNKIWIFVSKDKNSISSYAIFCRADTPEIGLKRVRLVDFQTTDDEPDILMEMISHGIKRCKKEGIHVLEVIGFNLGKRKIMEKYSPYTRILPTWPFYYKAQNEVLSAELENPDTWDPCLLDGDASL